MAYASIRGESNLSSSYLKPYGDLIINTAADSSVSLLRERMRVKSNGNVGIGTSIPTQKLSVNGSALISKSIIVNDTIKTPNITSKIFDTANFKPVIVDASGNQFKTSWQNNSDYTPIVLAKGSVTSASALTIDITNYIGTYDNIEIRLLNIKPSSNAVSLQLQVSNDGISFDGTTGHYAWVDNWSLYSSTGQTGNGSDNSITLANNCGNGSAYSSDYNITISNPGSGTFRPILSSIGTTINDSGDLISIRGSGQRKNAQQTKAIKIFYSSGNIDYASYKVVGLKN